VFIQCWEISISWKMPQWDQLWQIGFLHCPYKRGTCCSRPASVPKVSSLTPFFSPRLIFMLYTVYVFLFSPCMSRPQTPPWGRHPCQDLAFGRQTISLCCARIILYYTLHSGYKHTLGPGKKYAYNRYMLISGLMCSIGNNVLLYAYMSRCRGSFNSIQLQGVKN